MNFKKTAVINSAVGLISQVIMIVFQFLTRSLFLQYLGDELLGINSTFTSVIGALSLAELGFQTAIIYSLYKPLKEEDHAQINKVVSIFCYVYRVIGVLFIVISFVVLPFIRFILKGVEITGEIYIFFLLQAASTAFSYFLAYKRTLLSADQKEYIAKVIDLIVNVICNLLKIYSIVWLKNYYGYLIISIAQVVVSNLIVHYMCKRLYPYLKLGKLDWEIFRTIWKDVKDVFATKIAGYIYGSTDNIIISAVINTVAVTFFTNYKTIILSLKTLTTGMLSPLAPIIGRMLAEDDTDEGKERKFVLYSHIRFIIALVIVIPCYVLLDDCIRIWVGERYVMSQVISVLLCIDLYIHLVHSGTCDYINGSGLFKEEKKIEIIGAIINIVLSIALCKVWGIPGILLGTAIAQVWFWIGRSVVVYRYCFTVEKKKWVIHWTQNIVDMIFTVGCTGLCLFVYSHFHMKHLIIQFIAGGLMCEACIAVAYLLCYFRTQRWKGLWNIVRRINK